MTTTLYQPGQQSITENLIGFSIPPAGGFAKVPPEVVALLGCAPKLVDVLAIGPDYVIFTVFDHEGPANHTATQLVAELTDMDLDATNEDELLRRPVVVVRA